MRSYKLSLHDPKTNESDLLDHKSLFIVESIKNLDPVNFDIELEAIRNANERQEVGHLVSLLSTLTMRASALHIDRPEIAHAIMRDIGLVLGSIKRHGVEPCAAVPDVQLLLINLGRRTGLIPRDTVHHYTSWNPDGERRRRYTNDPQEIHLQDAVSTVFPHLSASLSISARLSSMEPGDVRFGVLMNLLCEQAEVMVTPKFLHTIRM